MAFNIDIAMFVAFLVLNLLVGLRYGRGVKTIQDYALGGRNFSTTALVATIVATWISGSMFFTCLSNVYTDGLSFMIPALGFPLSFFIPALIFVPKMTEFLGKTSVAEAMGDIYGKHIRIIVAIAGAIGSSGIIAVQFKVFGGLFSYFLGIHPAVAVILGGTVATLYSGFGGIRAVTFTDVLQFFTFGSILPLIGIIMWNHIYYDPDISLVTVLESPKFDLSNIMSLDNPGFWAMVALFLYIATPDMAPVWFQRVSMGSSIVQVKKAFIISGFLVLFITLVISWIPFLLYAVNPNLQPNELLGYIIDHYSFTGFKGLLIIALTAMALSTADSYINSSSVLFANDFCKSLKIGSGKELFLSKIFSIVIGLMAISFSFTTTNLLKIALLASSFYMPIVTAPLMLTILGFRSSSLSVLIGMGAGLATSILWKFLDTTIDGIIVCMIINAVFLVGSHYLFKQPGGWIVFKDKNGKVEKRDNILVKFFVGCKNFSFIAFCKKTAPKNELMYSWLGIYFIFLTFSTMYCTHVELLKENGRVVLTMYQIMMCSGTTMGLYPIWPPAAKHEIIVQIAWNILIFLILVFFSCFFVMVSNFGQLQFTIFTMNIMITAILVGWKLSAGMMLVGFYLSVQFYKLYANVEHLDISFGSPQFFFMYSLMLVGSALIIFFKPKEEYIKATEIKVDTLETDITNLDHEVTDLNEQVTHYTEQVTDLNEQVTHYTEQLADKNKEIERLGATAQKILNNVNHELRLPIGNVINFSEMLYNTIGKSDNKLLQELSKEVYDNSNRVSTMILNMLDLATLEVKKVDLEKKTVNFSEMVEDRVNSCRKIYLRDKKINFDLTIEPELLIAIDPNYIRQTIDNLLINSINFSTGGLIKISVSKQKGDVIFTIVDQGKGIPMAELSDIFTPFKMGSNTESKASGRGVGLALCKSAVEAHGGTISAESNGIIGATLKFSLPFENIN